MKEKCIYCNKEFDSEEIEKHKFTCVSSFNEEFDFSNKIPCEVCNELINFEDYERHVNICSASSTNIPIFFNRFQLMNSLFPPLNNLPNPDVNENLDNTDGENENNSSNLELESESGTGNINLNIQQNIDMVNRNLLLINNFLNRGIVNNTQNVDTYESYMELDENVKKEGICIENISNKILLQEETKCPICFENFSKDDSFREVKCSHQFCEECLTDWCEENKKCPVCMIEF